MFLDMHTACLIADLERRFDEHPDPGWASRPGACDPSLAERLLSGSRRTRTQEGPARQAAPRAGAAGDGRLSSSLPREMPMMLDTYIRVQDTYIRVVGTTAITALLSFALNIPFHGALAIGSVLVLSTVLVGAYNYRVRSLPSDARARWNRTPGGFSLPVRAAVSCVLVTAGVLYLKVHISPRYVGIAAICAGFAVPGLDALVSLAQLRRWMISESFHTD